MNAQDYGSVISIKGRSIILQEGGLGVLILKFSEFESIEELVFNFTGYTLDHPDFVLR